MPTNDERREVAEMLREYSRKYSGVCWPALVLELDCGDFETCEECSTYCIKRLADLIEPETERTCKPSNKCGFPTCDCGELFKDLELPNFCPNCGAKVLR